MSMETYNEQNISDLFSASEDDALMKAYSLKELEQMYVTLYDSKPLSEWRTKKKLIEQMRYHFRRMRRAAAFG